MKLKTETDYAFRIILYFLSLQKDSVVDSKTISKSECIPEDFTLKILRKLCTVKILKAYRGVKGGYSLIRSGKEITLKEVIICIQNEFFINKCLKNNQCPAGKADCKMHYSLKSLQNAILAAFDNMTFEEVLKNEINR